MANQRNPGRSSWLFIGLGVLAGPGSVLAQADFVRCDVNQRGGLEIGDVGAIYSYLFLNGAEPACINAADADDSGTVDLTDEVRILEFLFLGLGTIPQPFPVQGADPTGDPLGCATYSPSSIPSRPSLVLGFDACPAAPIEGLAMETVGVELFATLTSAELPAADGPQSWSLSLSVAGASVREASLANVVVTTLFDDDFNPLTPLVETPLDLRNAQFDLGEPAIDPLAPARRGLVSAIFLNLSQERVLRPAGTERVLRIALDVVIPDSLTGEEVVLRFEDGFEGGGRPVENIVVLDGASYRPTLGECRFTVRKREAPPAARFIRCDPNDNGRNELADAAWIINALIRGGPPIACRAAGDCNGDSSVDLSDVISIVSYQFQGGPAPTAPFPSCGVDASIAPEDCPEGSTGCP